MMLEMVSKIPMVGFEMSEKKRSTPDPAKIQEIRNRMIVNELRTLTNSLLSRSQMGYDNVDGQGRDYDEEFGYPKFPLTPQQYDVLFHEESIAKRIVEVFPLECWSSYPELTENQKSKQSPFEKTFQELDRRVNVWHYCHRVDTLSGIGRFGVLFLGVGDGVADMSLPIKGLTYDNIKGEYVVKGYSHKVLYLRAFEENLVKISKFESDMTNVRYGQPLEYDITFADPESTSVNPNESDNTQKRSIKVHWSRVIHVADNRKSSEILGIPRMEQVGRRIYDIRKILGGSAEMFWRGAFPGYSFETLPSLSDDVEVDEESVRIQFEEYAKGLKRYLALTGMTAKSLAPQIGDPSNHMLVQLQMVCIALGVPMRIFMGTEAGHLASSEDAITWNRRLRARQVNYLNPLLINPLTDRFMMIGALPRVSQYTVTWNDINNATDGDKADMGVKITQSVLQYVSSGAEEVMPLQVFYTRVLGWTDDEARDAIAEINKSPKRTKKVWDKEKLANQAPGKAKDPSKRTGKSGQRNGLGR